MVAVANFTVSDPTTVVNAATRNGSNLVQWPDGCLSFDPAYGFRAGSGIAGGSPSGNIGLSPSTDKTVVLTTSTGTKYGLTSPKDTYAYVGGGGLLTYGGNQYLLYHAEKSQSGSQYYAHLGMALVTGSGAVFTDLGLVIKPVAAFNAANNWSVDLGSGSMVVVGSYLYIFFKEDYFGGGAGTTNYFGVARTLLSNLNTSTAPTFTKYSGGGWNTAGLGGASDPLESGNPDTYWSDVGWHSPTSQFVAVHAGAYAGGSALFLITSQDGIAWSARSVLYSTTTTYLIYPTLLTDLSRNLVNPITVYYMESTSLANLWVDGVLKSRSLSLTGPVSSRLFM